MKKSYKMLILQGLLNTLPKSVKNKFIGIFRNSDSKFGFALRSALYSQLLKKCGSNLRIAPGVFMTYTDEIEIGDNVSIQHNTFISGYGGLEIGNNVSIAPLSSIFTTSHPYDNPAVNIKEGGLIKRKIKIFDNVWIGASSVILYGVEIQSGIIVGANSTVTNSLNEENWIYAGSPAKKIKSRF